MLLELGRWDDPVHKIWRSFTGDEDVDPDLKPEEEDYFNQRRQLIQAARALLPGSCGEIYTQVTVACLSIEQEDYDSEEEEESDGVGEEELKQREICARIMAELAQCLD
ncbi:hypothetical protein QBC35DRAFT_542883 [Podospora australis]|uniref:Uncharacterized protein n=1 Tax=Podospora australis TaxID=1536484 RepID=A0AAN7AF43_9PEZI|nr:hypothetical protein QBC35DRAFT_542883 [Podospora australis]